MREVMAKHERLAFIVTNSTSRADARSMDALPIEIAGIGVAHVKPSLGEVWGTHGQHVRIFLCPDPQTNATFSAQVIKGSTRLPAGQFVSAFEVLRRGLVTCERGTA